MSRVEGISPPLFGDGPIYLLFQTKNFVARVVHPSTFSQISCSYHFFGSDNPVKTNGNILGWKLHYVWQMAKTGMMSVGHCAIDFFVSNNCGNLRVTCT